MREQKSGPRRQLIEEEQILVNSNFAMITFRRFFEKFSMLSQLPFVRKSDSVYPLQGIIILVTTEIA